MRLDDPSSMLSNGIAPHECSAHLSDANVAVSAFSPLGGEKFDQVG